MPWLPGLDRVSLAELPWFTIYLGIMITLTQLLLLTLILVLAYKLDRLVVQLDQISRDAGKFLQMGMTFFKKKK